MEDALVPPGPHANDPDERWTRRLLAVAALVAAAVVVATAALPLTDPDEVFYAGTAREMLAAGDLLTPRLFGAPQFEKPPLTYWLLAGSFATFGEGPVQGRIVPALAGALAALAVFLAARRLVSRETAALAALVTVSGLLHVGLSVALLTDMVLTACTTAALGALLVWLHTRREAALHLFGAALGVAVLAKGPVAPFIAVATAVIALAWLREGPALRRFLLHPWWLVMLAVAGPWYVWAIAEHGRAFWWEFFVHDHWHRMVRAEHQSLDRWWFYPGVMLVGMFPWTALLVFLGKRWAANRRLFVALASWIGVTFLLFTIAQSKLASYILPLFPALALALAVSLEGAETDRRRCVVAGLLAGAIGAALLAVPVRFLAAFAGEMRWALTGVAILGACQVVIAVLLFRGRTRPAFALAGAGIAAAVLLVTTTVPASATTAYTDTDLPAIVAKHGLAGQTVVTSKFFARGVRYHVGAPVVVVDKRARPWWSDHPVEVLSRDEQIRAFFASRDRVLCVVAPREAERLAKLFAGTRQHTALSGAMDRIVLLSERLR